MPSMIYQNYLKEFWCSAEVIHPTPQDEDSEARPLKESNIKFTIKNVKAELTKIDTHDVLGGNHSSTEHNNSSQQLIVFSLLTRTKIDIREIIYNDLGNKPAVKGLPSTADEDIRTSTPLSKVKPIYPKDSEGNIHPVDKGLPATHPDKGTRKTQPLPKGTLIDLKDSGSNIQLTDRGQPSTLVTNLSRASTKYQVDQTQSTRFEVSDPYHNKGKNSSEAEPNTKPFILLGS
ncbi:hypothetical protein Tco_1315101 [Tanacetum coccineum]